MRTIRTLPATGDEAFQLVPLAAFKEHLRIDPSDTTEDATLKAFLTAAVASLDGRSGTLGRALVAGTFQSHAAGPNRPSGVFALDLGPVTAVTKVERLVSGTYTEVDASLWQWRPGQAGEPWGAAVRPKNGQVWPTADTDEEAWRITFTAGFGPATGALDARLAVVPPAITLAVMMRAAHLYENRGASNTGAEPPAIESLLAPFGRTGV
jgi:uncharacterized phiE125 gp8 family phage protein